DMPRMRGQGHRLNQCGLRLKSQDVMEIYMKKLLIGVALALGIILPAEANDDPCKALEVTTLVILEAKNAGMPMSVVMDLAGKSSENRVVRRLMRALVMDAYNLPAMISEEGKLRQATQFMNKVSSACYQMLDNAGMLD